MNEIVVTVTPTIMSGTVVRWYGSEAAASNGREFMSASRDGVMVNVFLHQVPDERLAQAKHAYHLLRDRHPRGRNEIDAMATHEKGFRGELTKVVPL